MLHRHGWTAALAQSCHQISMIQETQEPGLIAQGAGKQGISKSRVRSLGETTDGFFWLKPRSNASCRRARVCLSGSALRFGGGR